jgi:hypothetical protein
MNSNEPIEHDDRLSRALRKWKVTASLPPRFQEGVWQRIARSEAGPKATGWKEFMRMIEAAFRRPALAVCYVAILLLVGLSAGVVQARQDAARMQDALGARYLQAVDPYQAPRH